MPQAKPKKYVRLRLKDLAIAYGCDVRTIFRYHVDGTIPEARYLPGKRWPFWYEHEILANEKRRPKLLEKRNQVIAPPTPPTPVVEQLSFKI